MSDFRACTVFVMAIYLLTIRMEQNVGGYFNEKSLLQEVCDGQNTREWQPTPVFLPGESHGWRSLAGYSPRVAKSWTRLSD